MPTGTNPIPKNRIVKPKVSSPIATTHIQLITTTKKPFLKVVPVIIFFGKGTLLPKAAFLPVS